MRKIILLIGAISMCMQLNAQLQLGIKASAGLELTPEVESSFFDNVTFNEATLRSQGYKVNRSVGISVQSQNRIVFVSGDVLWNQSKSEFAQISSNFSSSNLDPGPVVVQTRNQLRFVGLAGVKILGLRLGVGPELNMLLSQSDGIEQLEHFEGQQSKYRQGFNFLAGISLFNRLQLDVKYVDYFNDLGSGFSFGGEPVEMKSSNRMVELSAAIYF